MNVALVPAGGSGTRFGAARAKQFLELSGVPIVVRTLRQIAACADIDRIVVALPAADIPLFEDLLAQHPVGKIDRIVPGGKQRQDSVREALAACDVEAGFAVVHDAVRPFISPGLISATIDAAKSDRAAVVGHPVTDTIKEVENGLAFRTPPRELLYAIQTPQTFEINLLREAHARALRENWSVTDDAMLVEKLGIQVRIVPGPTDNLKITHPRDLSLAEFLLSRQTE